MKSLSLNIIFSDYDKIETLSVFMKRLKAQDFDLDFQDIANI